MGVISFYWMRALTLALSFLLYVYRERALLMISLQDKEGDGVRGWGCVSVTVRDAVCTGGHYKAGSGGGGDADKDENIVNVAVFGERNERTFL